MNDLKLFSGTANPALAGRNADPGVLAHHLAGRISQDEMLRAARKDKQMERLNLSEAWFYIGQRLLLAGDTESARRMFQRTVDIGALPYREHAFAQLELRRASAR